MFRLLISVINGKEDVRNFRIMINYKLSGREKKNHYIQSSYVKCIFNTNSGTSVASDMLLRSTYEFKKLKEKDAKN